MTKCNCSWGGQEERGRESLCGIESRWREKSCRDFCCAFVLWGEESDKGEVDVEEH